MTQRCALWVRVSKDEQETGNQLDQLQAWAHRRRLEIAVTYKLDGASAWTGAHRDQLRAAVDDGLIHRNPLHAKSVTRPEQERREAIPLTLAELDALSAALRHMPGCPPDCARCRTSRYELLPYLGAATGQRQGELFGLDAGRDIDFLRRVIHVRRQVKIIRGVQVFAACRCSRR